MEHREKIITLIFVILLIVALLVAISNLKKVNYELLGIKEMIITQFNMTSDLSDKIVDISTEITS